MNAYDALPYAAFAQPLTSPDRLGAIARLFGRVLPDPDQMRVLEIGCADGTNLCAMAAGRPGLQAVGVDPSAVQIAHGQARVEACGLRGVRLIHGTAEAVVADLAPFDLVICHGVWSWVDRGVAAGLLQAIRAALKPSGVAYVSYNTLPGWYQRLPVRDLMLRASRGGGSPAERVALARQALDTLADEGRGEPEWQRSVRNLRDALVDAPDAYLFHEYLAPHNRPVYFSAFAEAAAEADLAYLADADSRVSILIDSDLAAHDDRIEEETVADILRNQSFRSSLLVPRGEVPPGPADWRALRGLSFSGGFAVVGALDLREGHEATFLGADDTPVHAADPVTKALLALLGQVAPRSATFQELTVAVSAVLERDVAPDELQDALFRGVASAVITAHAGDDVFVTDLSERPVASPLARHQAANGAVVSTLRHTNARVEGSDRLLLRLLDGEHDGAGLVRAVSIAHERGEVELLGETVEQAVVEGLERLAAGALIWG